MDITEILRRTDHTLLRPDATWEAIRRLCDEGMTFGTASVCIPPLYVAQGAEYLCGRLPVCTVIGFPTGYSTTAVKAAETRQAAADGADEIDMVIPVGRVKEGAYDAVLADIQLVRAACEGKILKVIVETCLLTEDEKRRMCDIVSASGADYIKTSTGFSKGGATVADIRLFAAHVAPRVKIKAAGGIGTLADAAALLEAGADRLGSSRLVELAAQAAARPGGEPL